LTYICEKRARPQASRSKQRIVADKDEYTYCIGEGISHAGIDSIQAEFDDDKPCLDYILGKLLDHFHVRRITQYFREFVANELDRHIGLPPLLKQLYMVDMGRKRRSSEPLDTHMLNIEDLELDKKEELAEAVNNGKLTFLEGIPFLAF